MRVLVAVVAFLLSTGFASAAEGDKITSGEDCWKVWKKASPDGHALSESEAKPYIQDMASVDTSKDGQVSGEEWKQGCVNGLITSGASGQ